MPDYPCEVMEITGQPIKNQMRLDKDGTMVEWWSVPVVLKTENEVIMSNVTFETLEEALELKKGDTFQR